MTIAQPDPLVCADVRLTLTGAAGPVEILKGVSLVVAPGERVAITGPSGSGKSSLLAVAAGLERASGGSIKLMGEELVGKGEDELAHMRRGAVGIVFQAFHLLPAMTAQENVETAFSLAGAGDALAARQAAGEALARVGLNHRARHYPAQLSGGEQQRVAVARAVAARPKLLFADEPTGNLDAESGAAVRDLIFSLAREDDASLLIVTHNTDLAARCDRTIRLVDGRSVA
jgi:putative ABC transport system ATP-binding protein